MREVVVADRVEDLPPDALKMVQNAGLMPDSFPKLYDYWPILLHSLRFLTKRTYLRSGFHFAHLLLDEYNIDYLLFIIIHNIKIYYLKYF